MAVYTVDEYTCLDEISHIICVIYNFFFKWIRVHFKGIALGEKCVNKSPGEIVEVLANGILHIFKTFKI